jgi:L-serine/L-threonine ammonia-lyase
MLHLHTPLIESLPLSELSGGRIFLKMEALQPSGSFKLRGIGYACEKYRAEGATRFLASSGGNAGIAVAYAGRKLGVPVEIVVPQATKADARRAIVREGAKLHVQGATWNEAHAYALSLLTPQDRYIHPFDDPLLWEGHASLIDEVVADGLRPDAVVLSVGGGGLLCGVVAGLRRHGLGACTVYGIEPEGADSFAQALQAGKAITIERVDTLAVSLGARKVTQQAVECAKSQPVQSLLVNDEAAIRAVHHFLRDHRMLVELGCSVALAPIYEKKLKFERDQNVLVIICGGMNTSLYLDYLTESW